MTAQRRAGSGAEIDVIDIAGAARLGGLHRFAAHILAAAAACCVHGVLAVMLALGDGAAAGGLGGILAHLGAGLGGLEASVRRDKFGLLGKSGAGGGKYGDSGDQVLDVHGGSPKWCE